MALRSTVKSLVLAATRLLGANGCARLLLRRRVLVLCYHSVIPDDMPHAPQATRVASRVADFRWQMAALARLFKPISAGELLEHFRRGNALPARPALVTFDDGFRNNLAHAAPVLQELGIPALVHLTAGHIGQSGLLWTQELDERIMHWRRPTLPMPGCEPDIDLEHSATTGWQLADRVRAVCKRLPNEQRLDYLDRLRAERLIVDEDWYRTLYAFLSWDDVRQLARGGISIGSHTLSHPILTRLTPPELERELVESKRRIEEEVSCECAWFAYPNGGAQDVSASVVDAVARAGYGVAFTLLDKANARSVHPLLIDRICIPGQISRNAFDARLNGLRAIIG